MSARVQVIEFVEEGENPDGLFSKADWTLKLPEKIQGDDVRRIEYVVVRDEHGGAELYGVTGWVRTVETMSVKSKWTLQLGINACLHKTDLENLMKDYASGQELTPTFVNRLKELLLKGFQAPPRPYFEGVLRSSMSLSEAKLAVSKFYRVELEQVQISIIG